MTENAVTIALIASEVSRLFAESKIRLINRTRYESWPADTMAFEDEYSVIVFWPFKSIQEMTAGWVSVQDHVVRLVGDNRLFRIQGVGGVGQ